MQMKMGQCHKAIRYFHHGLSGKEVKDQQILKDYKKKRRDFSSVSFFSFVSKF
jgi:hypothetical protein